jgi:prepilin-type processing-associated H-X9-DG protein
MKKSNAFTKTELVVVVLIINLLLAVSVPALNQASEQARRAVCSGNLRAIGVANENYAADNNGWFVPAGYSPYDDPHNNNPPEQQYCNWVSNAAYRMYIDIDNYRTNIRGGLMISPVEFLCPSDKISNDPRNVSQYSILLSYAYNITDWNPWSSGSGSGWLNRIVGHRVDSINKPAEKLIFIDAIDWWTEWGAADYRIGWDKLGQDTADAYRSKISPRVYGPVFYRHNEGANILFYDGHVEWRRKQDIFVVEDWNAAPKIPGIWSNYDTYPPP